MSLDLDRIDLRILAALERDGRIANAELAERVHLSPSACLRRLQRLEREGLIRGYRAELDPERLGLNLMAFVRVQLERHDQAHVQRFADLVGGWEEVRACYALTGDMDYLLQVQVQDLKHFSEFIMHKLMNGGVADVNSSFVLGTVKPPSGLIAAEQG